MKTSKQVAPRVIRDKETRECFLVINGSSHPVDSSDLMRTIGSGMHAGCGLIDAWPIEAWEAILTHLSLPATSVDRKRAQWVIKRFVQKMWLAAFEPVKDDAVITRMAARDLAVCKKYLDDSESTVSFGSAGRAVTREKVAQAYMPTEALKSAKGLKGQAKTLLAFFKKMKFMAATTAQAADGMVACGLKTSTAPARIAAFYLCDWAKKGWLVRRPHFG
jgi:hypothetical protein